LIALIARLVPGQEGNVLPRSGDVLQVTRAASVQFAVPMLFRVIRVHDWPTYDGWLWLDGYELNAAGDAVERRSIFVQLSGLRQVGVATETRAHGSRRPVAKAAANQPTRLAAVHDAGRPVRDAGRPVRGSGPRRDA
jgi:hypothetical protein